MCLFGWCVGGGNKSMSMYACAYVCACEGCVPAKRSSANLIAVLMFRVQTSELVQEVLVVHSIHVVLAVAS